MKEVADMTDAEYAKWIMESGVKPREGSERKIITMSAEGKGKMSVRKKIAIGVLVGLPVIGIVAPLLMKGTKDEKILLSIFGGLFGLVLGAGLSVAITPEPKEK